MRCTACDTWNGESNTYCVVCGTALASDDALQTPVEELSRAELQELVYRLQVEVGRIQEHLSRNRGVLGNYERRRPARPAAAPSPSASASDASETPDAAASAESTFADSSERDSDHELRGLLNFDWEMVLGGNWLARIGILAVVIGVGFFLKLAFDNNWIEDAGRVALGVVGGLALLGGGEYLARRYPVYSQSLSGGGVAILYLTIFAAFAFYGMLGVYPAIGLLFLVSLTAAALALRRNSMALAVIAVLGAFSAPFVIGLNAERGAADAPPDANILLYVIMVDLGVLALSTFRNWRWLTLLALAGSSLSFIVWYAGAGRLPDLAVSLFALTTVFLIFAGVTTLFHVIWRRAPKPFDYTLIVLNATSYIAFSYLVMWDDLRDWMGAFALALALFYALLAFAFYAKVRERPNLARMAVSVSAVLFAIAAAAQFDGNWIGASWAVQAAALIWLSFKMESWQQRLMGAGGLAIAFVWTLSVYLEVVGDALIEGYSFRIPMSYALSSAIVIAAFFVAAYLDRRYMRDLEFWRVEFFPAPVIGGGVLLAFALWMHLPDAWTAAGLAVEALALIWASYRLNARGVRIFGFGVFALLGAWLLTVESPRGYVLFLNLRMLTFALAIAALYAAALLTRREPDVEDWETYVPYSLAAAANALTLWFLSFEAMEGVDRLVSDTGDTAFYAKSLALSLVWALYASVGLALGILMRWRIIRLASLCLLAVPIVKLFLFDSFALDQGYRVAAFLSLGAILLVGGLLYQRHSEAIRGFLFEERESPDAE